MRVQKHKSIRDSTKKPDDMLQDAVAYHNAGKLDQAAELYREILKGRPDDLNILYLLVLVLFKKNDNQAALGLLNKLLKLDPNNAAYYQIRSKIYKKMGCLDDAMADAKKNLEYNPKSVDAYLLISSLLIKQAAWGSVIELIERAVSQGAVSAKLHGDLGYAYFQSNKLHHARECYKKSLKLFENNIDALSGLSVVSVALGQPEEGLVYAKQALALKVSSDLYMNLGFVYQALGEFKQSLVASKQAVSLDANNKKAQFNLSLSLLLQGDWRDGWRLYEARFSAVTCLHQGKVFPQPSWQGESLRGKTLFLYSEQGIGDAIQFFRYLPLIKSSGAKVILACQTVLQPLFELQGEVDQFVDYQAIPNFFDFRCAIGSLPFIFKTMLDSIPKSAGYLSVSGFEKKVDFKKKNAKKIHVALVWSGNPKHARDTERSIPLDVFSPLFELEAVQFYSLQYGEHSQDIKTLGFEDQLIDLSSEVKHFADTASLLDQLDLLITIDSAPAHLAGALGVPAWVLVTAVPDWRWLLDREDSPWYDSIRLFRQPMLGDWAGVIERVRAQLIQELDLRETAKKKEKKIFQEFQVQKHKSIRDSTKKPDDMLQDAVAYHNAGKLDQAAELYREILKVRPKDPDALHLLGVVFSVQGDDEGGLKLISEAIQLNPDDASYYQHRSEIYSREGNVDQAIADRQEALVLDPSNFDAHFHLGRLFLKKEMLREAAQFFESAIELNPNDFRAYFELGSAYFQSDEYEKARGYLEKALQLSKNNPAVLTNLGHVFVKLGCFEEAVFFHKEVLKFSEDASGYYNLGLTYHAQGSASEAIFFLKKALLLEPDNVEFQFALGWLYLEKGNFELGLPLYEARILTGRNTRLETGQQNWLGENLDGKTLFLYAEQGLGDVIQFSRYISLLRKGNAKIIFSCQNPLIPMFEDESFIDDFIEYPSYLKQFDYHCAIASLPFVFKAKLDSIPFSEGYLSVPKKQNKIDIKKNKAKAIHVGLVWGGDKDHKNDANRSIPLNAFSSLFELNEIQFYSLQYGERSRDIEALDFKHRLVDLSSEISDFGDTASILDQLDLLITIDSAPAHLAGALGVPAWVLITAVPDWRWMLDREDSPWYDSIRLFRQPQPGDWASVIQQVKGQLIQHFGLKDSASEAVARNNKEAKDKGAMFQSAIAYHASGKLDEAAALYQAILKEEPVHADSLHLLGALFSEQGQQEKALKLIDRAIQIDPGAQSYYQSRSTIYQRMGRFPEAISDAEKLLELAPNSFEVCCLLASLFVKVKQFEKAIGFFNAAAKIKPNEFRIYADLGCVYFEIGDFEQAVSFFKKALAHSPCDASSLGNLRQALSRLNRPKEAIQQYESSLMLGESAELYYGLAMAYRDDKDFSQAIFCLKKSLSLDGDNLDAQFSLGLMFLLQGEYDLGWPLYESRFSARDTRSTFSDFAQPSWLGESIEGKTLFLYADQGYGDMMQFFRYIHLIEKKGGEIVLGCPEALNSLFCSQALVDRFVSTIPEDFDFHLSLSSLPFVFKTTLSTIPRPEGYLALPDNQKKIDIQKNADKKIRVGLVWSGNKTHKRDAERSISLPIFSSLFELDAIEFYSLQYGERSQDIEGYGFENHLVDLSSEINNFRDSASILKQLDLLISVDSAPAHLAGAMGLPAWVLITAFPDWRWMLDREDSPWYDSITLFRQSKPGDWTSVVQQVKDQLIQKFDLNKNLTGVY